VNRLATFAPQMVQNTHFPSAPKPPHPDISGTFPVQNNPIPHLVKPFIFHIPPNLLIQNNIQSTPKHLFLPSFLLF
jgi:hypothetical protein